MEWLSGFIGFRFRTLLISFLVVYLLLRWAKLSPKEKGGIWLSGLAFFVLRLVLESLAVAEGAWTYAADGFSLAGMPLDIFAATGIFFGSGAALIQHHFSGQSRGLVLLSYIGLALAATLYDFVGAAMYGYFFLESEGFFLRLLIYFLLTLASGAFYVWYRIRRL